MQSPYTDSLAHTTGECKYHIVFVPKFRRKEIYGTLKRKIGMILRELCRRKEVEVISAKACPDHIHMYVSIPLKLSVSSFMGYLKWKSILIIFEIHANLKYKYGDRIGRYENPPVILGDNYLMFLFRWLLRTKIFFRLSTQFLQ